MDLLSTQVPVIMIRLDLLLSKLKLIVKIVLKQTTKRLESNSDVKWAESQGQVREKYAWEHFASAQYSKIVCKPKK